MNVRLTKSDAQAQYESLHYKSFCDRFQSPPPKIRIRLAWIMYITGGANFIGALSLNIIFFY